MRCLDTPSWTRFLAGGHVADCYCKCQCLCNRGSWKGEVKNGYWKPITCKTFATAPCVFTTVLNSHSIAVNVTHFFLSSQYVGNIYELQRWSCTYSAKVKGIEFAWINMPWHQLLAAGREELKWYIFHPPLIHSCNEWPVKHPPKLSSRKAEVVQVALATVSTIKFNRYWLQWFLSMAAETYSLPINLWLHIW